MTAFTFKSKKFSSNIEKETKQAYETSISDLYWMKAGNKFESIILRTICHKVQIGVFLLYEIQL